MLHLPDGGVHAPEWQELSDRIQSGDGAGWRGDPTLYLQIGVVTHKRTGKQARRLEVWKLCRDGSEQLVGTWSPAEQFRVCYDLAKMRADRPGGGDVLDRIDKHNEKMAKDADDKYNEIMETVQDHVKRVFEDRNGPRTRFYMGGRDAARA